VLVDAQRRNSVVPWTCPSAVAAFEIATPRELTFPGPAARCGPHEPTASRWTPTAWCSPSD